MSRLLRRLFSGRSKRSTATSSRTLELNDLSDWDLLCLTDVLPLEDLLRLCCVSHRFNQLANRRQPLRRDLLLIIGPKRNWLSGYPDYQNYQNVITVPALTITLVDRILSKLPSIVSLWVYNFSSDSENLEPTIYLLGCLSAQLQTLRLFFYKTFHPPISQQPLFATINRLAKLTSLHLEYDVNCQLSIEDEPATIELPIISQLAFFRFQLLTTSAEPLLRQLIQRATASTPTKIIFGADFDVPSLDRLLDIAPGLAARFIFLQAYSDFSNSVHLENICDKFKQLTVLGIRLNHLAIRQVASNLVKLPHLSALAWSIHFPNRTLWRQQPDVALGQFGEAAEPDVVDSNDLVPLPTVKELHLTLVLTSHKDLALLHLATLFPNVTMLNLILVECAKCGYNQEKKVYFSDEHRCLMKLTKYWRVLPKLQELQLFDTVVPRPSWQPLPLIGVSRGQLSSAILHPVDKIRRQCFSWITSKFTFTV